MNKVPLTIFLATTLALAGAVVAEGPPLVTVEYQITRQQVVGLVPEGLRIDFHFSGTITDGFFAGATAEGIDYLLVRHDGVGVLDVRVFGALPDGTTVAWTVMGFAGDPDTMPPLEAWLDPDVVPDMDVPLHGAAWFQTMAPAHAYLNHTVLAIRGTVNLATGTIRAMGWSLAE
jgi:hypothetical protein